MRAPRILFVATAVAACGGDDGTPTEAGGASAGAHGGAGASSTTTSTGGAATGGGAAGAGGSGTGVPVEVDDHCACITGGDQTGTGYADADCEAAQIPYQPEVHFCEDFDTDDYAGEDGIIGEDLFPNNYGDHLDHAWAPDGGWRGGAAELTQQTFDGENDDGIFIPWPEAIASAPQANLGYLFYAGADWDGSLASSQEWKHTLIRTNGINGQTAMLGAWPTSDSGTYCHQIWSACSAMGGLCQDELGQQYPGCNDGHSFVPAMHAHEWIYLEMEHVAGDVINLYVFTAEGNVVGQGPMASIPSMAQTPHVFDNARILAYLEGTCVASGDRQSVVAPCTAESFARVDMIRLANAYMGPPAGFLGGAR